MSASSALGNYTAEQVERYYANGDWQDGVLIDIVRDRADAHPERTFVTDGTLTLTYGQLREDAIRLAVGLRGLGVERGDRVVVQMPNWAEFATIVVALSRLGAILVPTMPIFRHDEVGYVLEHSEAKVVIGPHVFHRFDHLAMFTALKDRIPTLDHVVVARAEYPDALDGAIDLASLAAEGDLDELDASLGDTAGPDDGCLVVYTSGTTSRPKGCFHTFNTIHAAARLLNERLHVDEGDVMFNPSPVSHSTGLITGLLMPLMVGGGTHFMPVWAPDEGIERIREYGCTITVTSTTFLTTVMEAFDPERHDLSSMRYWVCAGAPIPGAVVQSARAMFPSCQILSLYGRSENMTTALCAPEDAPEKSVLSDGRALADSVVKVVDEDGVEVPAGTSGDIAYQGPSHMLGYYRDPEQTAALFTPDGFSRSGDLGVMDADGFVRVSGRIKDIIIRGGINISSREVEDLLGEHPAVRTVAVVAMPDPRLGERSCAFVVVAPGHDEPSLSDLTDFLRSKQIAVQKLPERLVVIDELPMTPVGKVRKNVLRDRIASMLAEEQRGVTSSQD
ncbi:AMP-binding protein [Curtobacterium sp. MCBD17_003]|uniref:AMP-binding protein n=1 Tax=Curtobacterium sp. MCBD17_003 TaxID=2175667 RepID=UPI000DA944D8|nr:AMP-binding protein [Curtobacterium sp. MCBD17_003]WIE55743.1 AMP-binding protein [Curtobacterium sp. MCBD17_003]